MRLKGLFWSLCYISCIHLLSVMLLRAIISIIICMLMIVSFTLLLKRMMHPRSKTWLKAVFVRFVVGWIAIILSWTNIKLKLYSSLRNFVMALLWITWTLENERIPLSHKATSLGIVVDKHMSFDHHIKHLCKSLVCQFSNLFNIRKYLNKESAATVVYAFITSKLDHYNSLFYGLPNYQLRKL